MVIVKNSVVSLSYQLTDATGKILEQSADPISYLHGGYSGIFPLVEEALHGKRTGDTCSVFMEPENTFGEYDAELLRTEPRDMFPADIAVGMQFEAGEEGSDDVMIFTVTDITDDTVVVDGNHPLAGLTLTFDCTVTGVREATADELEHGHVHGAHGHHH